MRYAAKRGIIFGVMALIMTMVNFQPTAEAAFVPANNSQDNLQLNIQQEFLTEDILQFDNQVTTVSESEVPATDDPVETANAETVAAAKNYRATAYCLRGRTASGSHVRKGIVAADTRLLPLGTRIQVQAGAYSGTYTVADTGGKIKGRILDIWMPSCAEARRFGRRSIKVTVIGKKKRR